MSSLPAVSDTASEADALLWVWEGCIGVLPGRCASPVEPTDLSVYPTLTECLVDRYHGSGIQYNLVSYDVRYVLAAKWREPRVARPKR
jgi:hypothetical protein